VLTPDATVVIVGAKFPSDNVLGPLSHVIATRLAAVGKGQTVKFFMAKIEKDDLLVLQELLETGKVRSVIDRSYELREAADALRYLGEGHARGKVVLTA
jgi:NADPH:quinone reductase-like Zn-dependent oxidoreductase